MDDFSISIDTRELDEALAKLPEKVAGRIANRALQAAGDVMLESMKAVCPVRTDDPTPNSNALEPGVLQESLTTQVLSSKGQIPRVKVGAPIETAHVAWWIENGFDSIKAKRHIEGKHFMASAFDESAQKSVDVLLTTLAEGLSETKTEEA